MCSIWLFCHPLLLGIALLLVTPLLFLLLLVVVGLWLFVDMLFTEIKNYRFSTLIISRIFHTVGIIIWKSLSSNLYETYEIFNVKIFLEFRELPGQDQSSLL